ncbi:MAG: alanine--tRNA ligase, partial [Patescibacteria group bacterium]
NDPTVLFTTAGMHPLVPYLLGEKHPAGKRLVNIQKCIRTGDIDEVGDAMHLTFFEMLGNWSLGDYSKKEAIEWSFEFLTGKKWLGIDPKMLAVSVYEGDENIPADEEAAKIWHKLGIPKERIAYLAREDNWWGPAGETGPCGPDSEMFYWTGDKKPPKEFDPEDKRWVEIWNDVFMQYNKTKDGAYEPLAKKNIDTGMGLERTLTVLSGKSTVYDTELFQPILKKIEELSGKKYGNAERSQSHAERGGESTETAMSMRIIADHIRAATFILGDDKAIVPSNKEQGYILRRLIRRAIRHGYGLGIKRVFIFEIAEEVIFLMKDAYFELGKNRDFIINQLVKEEEKFRETLERGLKEFNKITGNSISGEQAFHLYDTYGFPLEMTLELARETGKQVDVAGFHKSFSKHQTTSRAGAEQKFKGGLADTSEISTKYHTATHLL